MSQLLKSTKNLEALHEVETVRVWFSLELMCNNFVKYCINAKCSRLFINDCAMDHVLSLL